MGIFNKNNRKDVIRLLNSREPEIEEQQLTEVDYNSALDYLVGLSNRDYDKIIKVSVIYRSANKEASKVLGIKEEATTALIDPPEGEPVIISDQDEDEIIGSILDDTEFIEQEIIPKKSIK